MRKQLTEIKIEHEQLNWKVRPELAITMELISIANNMPRVKLSQQAKSKHLFQGQMVQLQLF